MSAQEQYQLKVLTFSDMEKSIFDLPTIFKGTLAKIHSFSLQKGWKLCRDTSVFGFHYTDFNDEDHPSYLVV